MDLNKIQSLAEQLKQKKESLSQLKREITKLEKELSGQLTSLDIGEEDNLQDDGELIPLPSEPVNTAIDNVAAIESIVPPENVKREMKNIDGKEMEIITEFIGPKSMANKYVGEGDDYS